MFLVYDKNMNLKPFPKGVRPLDIFVYSMDKTVYGKTIEDVPGQINEGSVFRSRPIEVSVRLQAEDTKDYRLLRDEVNHFFSDDYFYITEEYQKGKRYKVRVSQSYIPSRLNQRVASLQFPLETTELPFAESIGTTRDIQTNGISSNDDLWGFGMGLLAEDTSLIYTHNINGGEQFGIYNAGNIPIHPFQQDLNIKISNVIGSTSFLQLRNDTTGNVFRVNELVGNTQVILLDGPNITSNGLQFLRKTNKQFIQLAPGWNYFTITGATSATVEFDFRFYYS